MNVHFRVVDHDFGESGSNSPKLTTNGSSSVPAPGYVCEGLSRDMPLGGTAARIVGQAAGCWKTPTGPGTPRPARPVGAEQLRGLAGTVRETGEVGVEKSRRATTPICANLGDRLK